MGTHRLPSNRSIVLLEGLSSQPESAILVGVTTPEQSRYDTRDALSELEQLARTAGADVTDRVTQALSQIHPATFIGSGKVEELSRLAAARDTDLVIFDDDLAPVQVRNLEKAVGCKLLDRSGLILDIFARRAQTAAAQTQVELAQLDYLRTRLTRRWTHLSRQKGGIGTKGPGETQIETDRRLIDDRIAKLKEDLEKIDRQRRTQRKGRSKHTRIAVVGYTNAGKSTLMNALAEEADVRAEDRLFATLDATTRRVALSAGKEALLSDTVGFIRKLPHKLIESFKSTLDEVRESDALLHVVDVTHPRFEEHMQVVRETLREIGAGDPPVLVAFNKIDALEERGLITALRRDYPEAAFVSALRSIGLEDLKRDLRRLVERDFVEREVYVPVTAPKTISYVYEVADVVEEDYLYARNGDPEAAPQAVARLRLRYAPRYAPHLDERLARFPDFAPVLEGERADPSISDGASGAGPSA